MIHIGSKIIPWLQHEVYSCVRTKTEEPTVKPQLRDLNSSFSAKRLRAAILFRQKVEYAIRQEILQPDEAVLGISSTN